MEVTGIFQPRESNSIVSASRPEPEEKLHAHKLRRSHKQHITQSSYSISYSYFTSFFADVGAPVDRYITIPFTLVLHLLVQWTEVTGHAHDDE